MLHMSANDIEAVKHAELASQLSGGDHPFYQEEYGSRLIDVARWADAQAVLEKLRKTEPKWGRVALRLGYARGVVMLLSMEAGLTLAEYPPATVKRAVASS